MTGPTLHRTGSGKPLLLVHGLGATAHAWDMVLPALARHREVITFELPGHGMTTAEADSGTFVGLIRSMNALFDEHGLTGIDVVGSSLGGRIVLELARLGRVGNCIALDPGGFWQGWEAKYLAITLGASGRLLRLIRPLLPRIAAHTLTRGATLLQLVNRPSGLDPAMTAHELRAFADTPTFSALVQDLSTGPSQPGPAAPSTGNLVIGWGRQDRLCLPRQAARAKAAFPSAELHWFEDCGHFPMWDQPKETVKLILAATA
jgi:pimeloyl-ACP methyl ester carboxylesterase